jgi:hypothetical protein
MKIGRNQPCPCQSGKKYKNCCRVRDEEARHAERAEAGRQFQAIGTVRRPAFEIDRLDELSNGVLDLLKTGRLDDAETMCQQLLTDFPELPDGHMRLGALCKARGDKTRAAEHLRAAAAMAQSPDFDDEFALSLRAEADELDPPAQ